MRRLLPAAASAAALLVLLGLGQDTGPGASPSGLATRYLQTLGDGHAFLAVDDCFDAPAFARRILKTDLDSLAPDELAYVHQLTSVILKATISGVPMGDILKNAKRTPFAVAGEGDEVTVSFSLASPELKKPREFSLVARRTDAGWKIVDVSRISSEIAGEYSKRGHAKPIEFLEGLAAASLEKKLHLSGPPTAGTPSAHLRESQAANLRAQLETLNNQLALFAVRTNHYPDLVGNGWTELLKAGYLKSAPKNPVNGRSDICAGPGGKATCGWTWDEKQHLLGACYFDESTGAITPDAP